MKRSAAFCLSLLMSIIAATSTGQVKLQYWIDLDARGSKEVNATGSTVASAIDVSDLSEGLHFLTYRALVAGLWSTPATSTFFIHRPQAAANRAVEVEYWIDGNTTDTKKISLTNNSGTAVLDLSSMSNGIHFLSYRAKADNGSWSAPNTSLIINATPLEQATAITTAQYWFDNDIQHIVTETLPSPKSPYDYKRQITVDTIKARVTGGNIRVRENESGTTGFYDLHYLHSRYSDDKGRWTAQRTDSFCVAFRNERIDVSFLIVNPKASDGLKGWRYTIGQTTKSKGEHYLDSSLPYFSLGNRNANNWSTSISQTISRLPAGTYMLSVVARGHSDVIATLSANGQSAPIATIGTEGGEIWNLSPEGSDQRNVNDGKGFGWNETNLMVTTDGSPLEITVEGSSPTVGGFLDVVDFRLTKVASTTLNVEFASSVDMSPLKGTKLRLRSNSATSSVTVSSKRSYEFAGLSDSEPYTITLLNQFDQVLWERDGFTIDNDGNDITISDIRPSRSLSLTVLDSSGHDVSQRVNAEWIDANSQLLATGSKVIGMADGNKIGYRISLGDSLGTIYSEPPLQLFEISETSAHQTCRLTEFPKATLSGSVTSNGYPPRKARVNVVQLLNGKYRFTAECSVDNDGRFSLSLPDDSLSLLISASGAYNYSSTIPEPTDIGNVDLKRIQSRDIRLSITTIDLHREDEAAEAKASVSGYDNLQFKAINRSQGDSEIPVIVQNGRLYIEDAKHGDQLELTATDQTGNYMESSCSITFNADSSMMAEFLLKAYGAVKVDISGSDNPSTEYILFDADGNFVRSAMANGEQTATISPLTSGEYTVVAIGGSSLMSMFSNFDALLNTGLKDGHDYVKTSATVTDAIVSEVKLPFLPRLDESKFYYTTDFTSFIVNQTQPIPGDYVTFTTRIDLKEEYKEMADGLQLLIDIPDGMDYIHNSTIVGSEPVLANIEGNKLVIPLTRENYQERIRFCFVPTQSGTSYTTATLRIGASNEIEQPIGRIAIDTRDFEINVPNMTARTDITINGTAVGGSSLVIYDNDIAIGTAEVKKDGRWQVRCTLNEAYHLSRHPVYAKITTPDGHDLVTPTRIVTLDIEANRVKTVTMINNWSQEKKTVFDFDSPKEKAESYIYVPSYPDFTFIVDFADNNPEIVDNVHVRVKTTAGTDRILKAAYDSISDKWIATGKFTSKILPINTSVVYDNYKSSNSVDLGKFRKNIDNMMDVCNKYLTQEENYTSLLAEVNTLNSNPTDLIDEKELDILLKKYDFYISDEEIDDNEQLPDNILSVLNDLLNCSDDNEFNTLFNLLLDNISPDINLNCDYSSITKLCNDFLSGNPIVNDSCSIVVKQMSCSEFNNILDDSYIIVRTIGNSQFYAKYSESEVCYYDTEKQIFSAIFFQSPNSIHSLKTNSADFDEYIASADKMISSLLADLSDATEKTHNWIEQNKGIFDGITSSSNIIQKLISKLISQLNKIGKKHGFNSNIIKSKIKLNNLSKLLGALNLAIDGLNFEHLVEDIVLAGLEFPATMDKCGELRATIVWAKEEHLNAVKEVERCLGKEKGAKYIQELRDNTSILMQLTLGKLSYIIGTTTGSIWSNYNQARSLYSGLVRVAKKLRGGRKNYFSEVISDLISCFISIEFSENTSQDEAYLFKDDEAVINELTKKYNKILLRMYEQGCSKDPEDPDDTPTNDPWNPKTQPPKRKPENSNNPNAKPLIDPSGFVYEAVTSNRLEGVEATIYEQGVSAQWDAENYHQVNPQITDTSGRYAWDVPVGNWQVRFSKRGYEPKATEWLPVPPPQLDINIPMVQAVNPSVKKAVGVPSGITVTFDKYMEPTLLTAERISVSRGGAPIKGRIELVNLEEDPNTGKSYASKAKFAPDEALHVGEVVQLHVDKTVESYANMPMLEDCTLDVTIQSEITSLTSENQLTVAPGGSQVLDIYAEPAEAAAGQMVAIHAASSLYSISDNKARFDTDGHATVSVMGKMPGAAPIVITIDNTELETETHINIAYAVTTAKRPKSSIPTGSTVDPGSIAILYTETEGANIYYTTDGSCPCDEATRILYTAPIIIDRDMTLKAVAEKDGLESSGIATFEYVISSSSAISSAADSRGHVIVTEKAISLVDLSGHDCRIYDLKGNTVWTGANLHGNRTIPLAKNEVFFVVLLHNGHVAVTKAFIH